MFKLCIISPKVAIRPEIKTKTDILLESATQRLQNKALMTELLGR